MPRACTICRHPDRAAIDAAILAGDPYRAIGRRHGVTHRAVARHRQAHLLASPVRADGSVAPAMREGEEALEQVRALLQRARDVLLRAESAGDWQVALPAIREARTTIESEALALEGPPKHPAISGGGGLGDVVGRGVVALRPEDSIAVAQHRLASQRLHHLPVVSGDSLVGLVSDRDVLRILSENGERAQATTVADVMTREPIHVRSDADAAEAARLLVEHGLDCLAVVGEGGHFAGVVTTSDLLRAHRPAPRPDANAQRVGGPS